MFVTKKRLYTELCKVAGSIHGLIDICEMEVEQRKSDIEDVKMRINYALNQLAKLADRVEALETKRHHRTSKKTTRKKGKQNGEQSKKRI